MVKAGRSLGTLVEVERGKVYGGTALRAARHFTQVAEDLPTLAVVDELQGRPEVEVVAVTGPAGEPRGAILRERIFALVGKPFGREILGRTTVGEVAEAFPCLDANANLFSGARGDLLAGGPGAIRLLVDGAGRFKGILTARDLSDFLSHMTQEDIDLAGRIQERLEECNEAIADARLEFSAWSRAAKGVGGDFWFTRELPGGKVFLALCDVSGKGVAASLVVSMVWGMLLMCDLTLGLEALLRRLNESLVLTFRLERYLTGFFAILDLGTGRLEVADMGHSHALVLRKGRALRLKGEAANMPLGLEADLRPALETWKLREGDCLFVYSDGLIEQEDEGGLEFGEARLAGAVLGALGPGPGLVEALPAALDRHRGRVPQQDDMSFLALGWRGGSA